MRSKNVTVIHVVLLMAGFWLCWCASGLAQLPEKFDNLQVLPKDITQRQLIDTMKGFAGALGVRCHYCHVGSEEIPLSQFDFASDEKENKRNARLMLKMTREIYQGFLTKLPEEEHARVEVTCMTCHRGLSRPQSLGDVLAAVVEKNGAEAGLAKYRELRERYYGSHSFDFTEPALLGLADKLKTSGRTDAASAFARLNLELFPRSAMSLVMLGELELAAGQREQALESFRKALEIEPKHPLALRRIKELETPPPAAGSSGG